MRRWNDPASGPRSTSAWHGREVAGRQSCYRLVEQFAERVEVSIRSGAAVEGQVAGRTGHAHARVGDGGQADVGQLRYAVDEDDVGRLDVAVDESGGVEGIESGQQVEGQADGIGHGHPATCHDTPGERVSAVAVVSGRWRSGSGVGQFHRVGEPAILSADVEDLN